MQKPCSKLFGSSGIRGLVNEELDTDLAARIGLAISAYARKGKVVVARDTRTSGLMLEKALVSGLVSGGNEVNLVGILPTPVLAYLTKQLSADAGVMITASHNPPEYNGIKIFSRGGMSFRDEEQHKIERAVHNGRHTSVPWTDMGKATTINAEHLYSEMILSRIILRKNWRIIVDPGCGATYHLSPALFTELGCKITALNAQPDGFFPARASEPNADSLEPLARISKTLKADLAIAYDGDGDRMALIDENGVFADFDQVLAAYAGWIVEQNGGGTIVTNVEASMCVENMVEAKGGRVVRTKVGDVYVTQEMERLKAVFGGEPCGALVHPEFHNCPDGILSSLLILKSLEDQNITLSEFVSKVPKYQTLRENVACNNEAKQRIVEETGQELKTIFPDYLNISTVDGFRITLKEGWILVRPSGTEPTVRLTVEGESLKAAKKIMEKGKSTIAKLVKDLRK